MEVFVLSHVLSEPVTIQRAYGMPWIGLGWILGCTGVLRVDFMLVIDRPENAWSSSLELIAWRITGPGMWEAHSHLHYLS